MKVVQGIRNPEWQRAIIEGIQKDPKNAYLFLEGIKGKEEELSSRETKHALIELIVAQQKEIEQLKELININAYSPTTLKRANRYLSFLETHKPTIDIVTQSIQAFWGSFKICCIVITSVVTLYGAYQAGIYFQWWPEFLKPEPPALVPNQTSQDSLDSSHPGSYTGSRTHSRSFADIQPKRGDKSPTRPASR